MPVSLFVSVFLTTGGYDAVVGTTGHAAWARAVSGTSVLNHHFDELVVFSNSMR